MNKPVIITCGLSGCGKSFNASHLERSLFGYTHLNAEAVREELGIEDYSRKDTPRMLAKMVEKIETLSVGGTGVIVDANLKTNDTRQIFYDLASSLKLPTIIIEFVCNEKEAKRRISERPAENGQPTDPAVYDRHKKFWQEISLDFTLPANDHVSHIVYDSFLNTCKVEKQSDEGLGMVSRVCDILKTK